MCHSTLMMVLLSRRGLWWYTSRCDWSRFTRNKCYMDTVSISCVCSSINAKRFILRFHLARMRQRFSIMFMWRKALLRQCWKTIDVDDWWNALVLKVLKNKWSVGISSGVHIVAWNNFDCFTGSSSCIAELHCTPFIYWPIMEFMVCGVV